MREEGKSKALGYLRRTTYDLSPSEKLADSPRRSLSLNVNGTCETC